MLQMLLILRMDLFQLKAFLSRRRARRGCERVGRRRGGRDAPRVRAGGARQRRRASCRWVVATIFGKFLAKFHRSCMTYA